jgi:oxalate---CoA ligase
LGSDQPIYVVDPHGVGNELIPHSIEAMAVDRLPAIMEAQSEGSYRLFGNCLGGIVAFEVARLLIAAGKKVEFVAMLDPPTVHLHPSVQLLLSAMRLARPIAGGAVETAMAQTWVACATIQKFCSMSSARRWAAIRNRLRGHAGGMNPLRPAPVDAVGFGKSNLRAMPTPSEQTAAQRDAKYAAAMANYVPKPLAVRVIDFSVDFSGEPLRRISSDVDIIKSHGNHYSLDFEHIVKNLKARLQSNN